MQKHLQIRVLFHCWLRQTNSALNLLNNSCKSVEIITLFVFLTLFPPQVDKKKYSLYFLMNYKNMVTTFLISSACYLSVYKLVSDYCLKSCEQFFSYGENKSHFNEVMMMSALYLTNTQS